ncbi:MAG: flavodoxin [Campylobacterales bacterium]
MDCGIFYGSTTGNTASIAQGMQKRLEPAMDVHVYDVANLDSDEELKMHDLLIFGASTWGEGDLQDDWSHYLGVVSGINLDGKIVAIFGLGDQEGYSDCFVDGMKVLYDFAIQSGAQVIGFWDSDDYSFDSSEALIDGKFVGLVIDEDNQSDLSENRLDTWCSNLVDSIHSNLEA